MPRRPGPNPTPTNLRVLRGNPGKRALPKKEPRPAPVAPERPDWLSPRGAEAWERIAPRLLTLGVLTEVDGMALALVVEAWAEWRDLRDLVDENGRVYECETKTGDVMVRARPEVAMLADAWRRTSAGLAEFGLTPAARSRVSAGDPPETDPFDDLMNRRR